MYSWGCRILTRRKPQLICKTSKHSNSQIWYAPINANAFSKVKEAMALAFAPVPVLA